MINASAKAQQWFIPTWDLLEDYYFGIMDGAVDHFANVIWPDSTVQYNNYNGLHWNWLHSMGVIVDPYADWYGQNGGQFIPDNGSVINISLDSLFVLGWYYNVDGNFNDTLVFEVIVDTATTGPAFDSIYDASINAVFSPPQMAGSATEKGWHAKLTDPDKYTIKYVLTPQDVTVGAGKYITIPVNQYVSGGIPVNPGEIVAFNISFVPGYSYNFGDTIFDYDTDPPSALMNSIRLGFYATSDPSSNPDVFLDPYNNTGSYNGTYLILSEGRYGLYPASSPFNEAMFIYTDWGLDAGAFFDWQVGVESTHTNAEIATYPNPASDRVTIDVEDYKNTSVRVYNMLGELVRKVSLTARKTQINVADLNNGTYIFCFISDQNAISRKVVVDQ